MDFPASLLNGYKYFIQTNFNEKKSYYKKLAKGGQKAKVLIICCCDSRAAPETIFNSYPGEIFVLRNIANQVPPFQPDSQYHGTSAALEFAVQKLGVKHIVVLGHARCGGVAAALELGSTPLSDSDFIGGWMKLLQGATEEVSNITHLDEDQKKRLLERISIRYSLANLRTFPWIRAKEEDGSLALHGAWFDIENGQLWLLNRSNGDFFCYNTTSN
ncbi:carbonic anhydrase [Bartonella sp. DGB1]|uniref:carbonic anhydrase n=1 Tax=Bartonella sp. DGB1 TaxID=3239807 RepID=UPI003525D1DE